MLPRGSDREKFAEVLGKKRQEKKGKGVKIEKKRRKIVIKRGEDIFFLLFTFEKTEICLGSTKIGIFYRDESISRREKNQEKLLCPLRKICLLRPCT